MSQTSQIVIDQISTEVINATNPTLQHSITSGDAVLVILVASTAAAPTVQVNGVNIAGTSALHTTSSAAIFYMANPPVGTVTITVTTVNPVGVAAISLLGVNKASPNFLHNSNSSAAAGTVSTTMQVAQANAMMIDLFMDTNLDVLTPLNSQQVTIVNEPVSGILAFASSFMLAGPGVQTMGWVGGTSATLVHILMVLEPAHAPSLWFPNVDLRNSNDVVGTNDLDFGTEILSATQQSYGYKSSTFFQNSFLHTIGRELAKTTGTGATVSQVAATVTASGGTQAIATVNDVAITQVGATVTASGGTQAIATVNKVAISQVAATITASGGTQAVATVNDVAIAQVHATITASGGTQSVTSESFAAITQVAATVTASGGTQSVATINNVAISQVAANLTVNGGTQSIATVNNVAITQSAANITASGGTQVIAAGKNAFISQVAATITAAGGTQAASGIQVVSAAISQVAATLLVSGGVQAVVGIVPPVFTPLSFTMNTTTPTKTLNQSVVTTTISSENTTQNINDSVKSVTLNTT